MIAREWSSIPRITYRLTDCEILTGLLPQVQHSRWFRPIWLTNAVLQLLGGSLHLYLHRTPIDVGLGTFQIVVGLFFAFQVQVLELIRRRRLYGPREFGLQFGDAGITVDGPAAKTVPWHAIQGVQDVGDVFLFQYGTWRSLIVPKRAFADDGATLWALLEDRLIAKRGLVRRPSARTIVNTARTA